MRLYGEFKTHLHDWWFFRGSTGHLHIAGNDAKGKMRLSSPITQATIFQRDRPYVGVITTEEDETYRVYLNKHDRSDGGLIIPINMSQVCPELWFHGSMGDQDVCPYCHWEKLLGSGI